MQSNSESAWFAALAKVAEQVSNLSKEVAVIQQNQIHAKEQFSELVNLVKTELSDGNRRLTALETDLTNLKGALSVWKYIASGGIGSGGLAIFLQFVGG